VVLADRRGRGLVRLVVRRREVEEEGGARRRRRGERARRLREREHGAPHDLKPERLEQLALVGREHRLGVAQHRLDVDLAQLETAQILAVARRLVRVVGAPLGTGSR